MFKNKDLSKSPNIEETVKYKITNKQTNEIIEEEFENNEDVYIFAMQMFFVDQHQPIIMELIHE